MFLFLAYATFLEQTGTTIDAAPPIMGETDTKRSNLTKWVQNLFLRPGDTILLPPGLKANTQAPAGDMPGHDTTVKVETMVLCAIIGVPYHQATGDWKEAPERAMRFAGADLKAHVTILRRQIEHQCLRKLWKDFVKVAQTVGAWTPPPGATEAEIYATEWQWPVIQQATLDRELNVMSAMVKAGQLPPSTLVEDYFGLEFEDMTRRYAQDAATATANGMLQFADKWKAGTGAAKRILAEAEARETHERDLVDQAKLDRSVLGSEID